MTYKCEICGSTHDTEGGLVAHLQNKEDEAHSEYDSRKKCWKHVMERNGELSLPDPDPEESRSRSEQPEQPTPDPDRSEAECPDCGSRRYYDAGEVLAVGDYSQEETRELIDKDHVCAACNEVF